MGAVYVYMFSFLCMVLVLCVFGDEQRAASSEHSLWITLTHSLMMLNLTSLLCVIRAAEAYI